MCTSLRLSQAIIAILWLALTGSCGGEPSGSSDEAALAPAPFVIHAKELDDHKVESLVVSPDGTRVYLGRVGSHDPKFRNLIVLSGPGAEPCPDRYYLTADASEILPANAQSDVPSLALDWEHKKLFATTYYTGASSLGNDRLLVYNLDASGCPAAGASPQIIHTMGSSAWHLALHKNVDPNHGVLYITDLFSSVVTYYSLTAGVPGPRATISLPNQGPYIDVAAGPARLYLADVVGRLTVLPLDTVAGTPAAANTAVGYCFNATGCSTIDLYELVLGVHAIYRRPLNQGSAVPYPALSYFSLSTTGAPTGSLVTLPGSEFRASTLAVDNAHQHLWLSALSTATDAFTGGLPKKDGVALRHWSIDQVGHPDLLVESPPAITLEDGELIAYASGAGFPVLVTQPSGDAQIVNYTSDYLIRVTVLSALSSDGAPPPFPVHLVPGYYRAYSNNISLGDADPSTDWTAIDDLHVNGLPYLRNQSGLVWLTVMVGRLGGDDYWQYPGVPPPHIVSLQVQIEIGRDDGNGVVTLANRVETVAGGSAVILVPGYASPDAAGGAGGAGVQLLSDYARTAYRDTARSAASAAGGRTPTEFIVSCNALLGGQGQIDQLSSEAEALGTLGCNTVLADAWGTIDASTVDATLDEHGLTRRAYYYYGPPQDTSRLACNPSTISLFDFQVDPNGQALASWIDAPVHAMQVSNMNGGAPEKVVEVAIADEPAFYFPESLDQAMCTEGQVAFHDFLATTGLSPQDFGATSYQTLAPQGHNGATASIEARHRFYWTDRFLTQSESDLYAEARQRLQSAYGSSDLVVQSNSNQQISMWYQSGKNGTNNPRTGLDVAQGSFDWFYSGRNNTQTLWTEDVFPDQQAEIWSVFGSAMRSAAGTAGFGGYVHGSRLGDHADGASYKILSLVGQGAKAIEMYCFGPALIDPGACWSEKPAAYAPIAKALRRIGQAEDVLFPGQAARGAIAILAPGMSGVWSDPSAPNAPPAAHYYDFEAWYLQMALAHAGHTVDFVSDADLAADVLRVRGGYTTLYVTQPNVSHWAQYYVGAWVAAGGTLIVTPGAMSRDEYDLTADRGGQPTVLNDSYFGVTGRQPLRDPNPNAIYVAVNGAASGSLVVDNAKYGTIGLAQPIFGPIRSLTYNGYSPVTTGAHFASGGYAILENPYTYGRVISYGYFPGWNYYLSPDRFDPHRLPRGWGDAQRTLAVAPVPASTPRAVSVSRPGVEALRLDSPAGIAIVLLNWTDEPIASLDIDVPLSGQHITSASSVERGAVPFTASGNVSLSIPLDHVDIISLR